MNYPNKVRLVSYFKEIDGSEYIFVEIDGEKRMFEACEVEKKDGTRRDSGC